MKTDSDRVLWLLENGRYFLTSHAKKRVTERRVEPSDLRELGRTGTVYPEEKPRKFRVVGSDFSGDPLTAIVVLEFDLLIITVF